MHQGWRRLKIWVGITLAPVVAVGIYAVILACGPNRDLVFVREIPSEVPLATLDESIRRIPAWNQWHYDLDEARAVDSLGRDFAWRDQFLLGGMEIRWKMLPKKRESRRYEMRLAIVEYLPLKQMTARLKIDGSGRLTTLFERLDWTIELIPVKDVQPPLTMIRGTLRARTANARARIFAGLAERILLNQVFLADLYALSGIKRPTSAMLLGPSRQ